MISQSRSSLVISPLTRDNYPSWRKDIAKHSIIFGDPASALFRNVQNIPVAPKLSDCYPSIGSSPPEPKYFSEEGILTADARRFFREDEAQFRKDQLSYQKDNDGLLHFLLTNISPSSETTLNTRPGFSAAVVAKDSFLVWDFIHKTHFKGSSRSTFRQLGVFLHLKQGVEQFEHFIEQLRETEQQVLANYGSAAHPGYILLSHITAGIFLQGIQQDRFQFKIESTLAEHPDGKIDDIWPIVSDFQQYNLEKEQLHTSPTGLEKGLIAGALPTCVTCFLPFNQPPGFSHKSNLPFNHKQCKQCYLAARRSPNTPTLPRGAASRQLIAAIDSTPTTPTSTVVPIASTPPAASLSPAAHQAELIAARAHYYAACEAAAYPLGLMAITDTTNNNPSTLALPPVLLPSDISFAVPPPSVYWDNAASLNIVNDIRLLINPQPLSNPFSIGGIGNGAPCATHRGILPFMPSPHNVAYFGATFRACLFSLGDLQRTGGAFATLPGTCLLSVTSATGVLLDHSSRNTQNLYPVSPRLLTANVAFPAMIPRGHYTAEEYMRADKAEVMHCSSIFSHGSDDLLCEAITSGIFSGCDITASDVRNNRILRGPCPQCAAGKMHQKSMPPSTSEPAHAVGQQLTLDIQALLVPSPGGNTHRVELLDEHSGHFSTFPAKSKRAGDIYNAIMHLVSTVYNAMNHKVIAIHTDSEEVLQSLVARLGSVNILLSFSPPGQHIQRLERYHRTHTERVRATLAGMPFHLPAKYNIYVDMCVAYAMNSSPNSRSRPSTPHELVTGSHLSFHKASPFLSFGSTCMVQQFDDKRHRLATAVGISLSHSPVSELGVCLGPDLSFPGSFLFVVANGSVMPRRVLTIVKVHPFNWIPQHVHVSNPVRPIRQTLNTPVQDIPLPPHPDHVNDVSPILFSNPTLLPELSSFPLDVTPILPIIATSPVPVVDTIIPLPADPLIHLPTATSSNTNNFCDISPANILSTSRRGVPLLAPPLSVFFSCVSDPSYLCPHTWLHTYPVADAFLSLNPLTDLHPIPTTVAREFSLKNALNRPDLAPPAAIDAAVSVEMQKCLDKYTAFRPIDACDIRPGAVHIYSSMLIKLKVDGRLTARLAAGGDSMPPGSYGETFAPCVDDVSKNVMIAAFQAKAYLEGVPLCLSDFDVPGAFLNVPLPPSDTQYIMHLQPHLPHPLAGRAVLLLKAVYGLKQSNHLFDVDFRTACASASFFPTPSDPCLYVRSDPIDPTLSCALSMIVDDGLSAYTPRSRYLYDALLTALEVRYGTLTKHDACTTHAGTEITRYPNGAIKLTQSKYINRVAAAVGVSHLPSVPTPSSADLFLPPTELTPISRVVYQKLTGSLVHALKTRHDVRKETTYLSTKNVAPCMSDYSKALHTLRYLASHPDEGPTFYTTEGPVLYAYVDAAYGVHTSGHSQTGYFLCIGSTSAPICCKSHSQQYTDVATAPMFAEYYALSEVVKVVCYVRQLLTDLGFPPTAPTTIFEDNLPAIHLADAEHVTRKSKSIFTRYHNTRDMIKRGVVSICHLNSLDMSADFLTKYMPRTRFEFLRRCILNDSSSSTSF